MNRNGSETGWFLIILDHIPKQSHEILYSNSWNCQVCILSTFLRTSAYQNVLFLLGGYCGQRCDITRVAKQFTILRDVTITNKEKNHLNHES